jgi:hypothetical protein
MVSGIPPVDMTQNERFLSCDTILLEVQYSYECPVGALWVLLHRKDRGRMS